MLDKVVVLWLLLQWWHTRWEICPNWIGWLDELPETYGWIPCTSCRWCSVQSAKLSFLSNIFCGLWFFEQTFRKVESQLTVPEKNGLTKIRNDGRLKSKNSSTDMAPMLYNESKKRSDLQGESILTVAFATFLIDLLLLGRSVEVHQLHISPYSRGSH